MHTFNFIQTIIRFAQPYTVKGTRNIVFLNGRETGDAIEFDILMSLQPKTEEVLKMFESGDWDEAEYIGFQYPEDDQPIQKDTVTTRFGDLKCIKFAQWDDYGVFVTGWNRLDAYKPTINT